MRFHHHMLGSAIVLASFLLVARCDDRRTSVDAENLLQWLRSVRATSKFELALGKHGFEARASEDIAPEDVIMTLPSRLCLTGLVAVKTFGEAAGHPFVTEPSWLDHETWLEDFQLSLALLAERHRGPKSQWHSYIRMMPTEPLDMHRNTLHPEDVARVLAGTVSVGQLQGRLMDHHVAHIVDSGLERVTVELNDGKVIHSRRFPVAFELMLVYDRCCKYF